MDFDRFDIATKELVEIDPPGWIEGLGIGRGEGATLVDSGITALTASVDKAIRVAQPEPFLVTIEFQSSHDADLLRSLAYRQAALEYRHDLAVLTVLILLRKEANSPSLTGTLERRLPDGQPSTGYDYRVVRLWQESPELFLRAGAGLAPLAPLTDVPIQELPAVVRRMEERIRGGPRQRVETLSLASYLLMGLRYSAELAELILQELPMIQESTTYQKILRDGQERGREEGRQEGREEGRLTEAQRMVIHQATKRFGEPDSTAVAAIEAIDDVDRLEALLDQVVESRIGDWNELLRAGRSG